MIEGVTATLYGCVYFIDANCVIAVLTDVIYLIGC